MSDFWKYLPLYVISAGILLWTWRAAGKQEADNAKSGEADEVAKMRKELQEMKTRYDTAAADYEKRIARLEAMPE